MITRFLGAFIRAIFIYLLIMMPSVLVPGATPESVQFAVLMAGFLSLIIFLEYGSVTPIVLTFRGAPPYNRARYLGLLLIVFILTTLMRGDRYDTPLATIIYNIGSYIRGLLDFPYSPFETLQLLTPVGTAPYIADLAYAGAIVSYVITLGFIIGFGIYTRLYHWPRRNGQFNVLTNLPMFDPTSGGDVLQRLKRGVWVYAGAGLTLPFLLPVMLHLTGPWVSAASLADLQLLVWIITFWACIPANLLMRSIAMHRIVILIEEKRRQRYTEVLTDGNAFA